MSQRDEVVQIVKRMPKEEVTFFFRFLSLLVDDPEFMAELDRLIPKNCEITEREWRIAVDLVEKWEQRKKTDSSETGGKCCEKYAGNGHSAAEQRNPGDRPGMFGCL